MSWQAYHINTYLRVLQTRDENLWRVSEREAETKHWEAEYHGVEPKLTLNIELGTRLLQALIDLAKRRNLYLLEAEILADQTNVIKAFKNLGFEQKCNLDDYFMLLDGEFRDVAHLILRLRARAIATGMKMATVAVLTTMAERTATVRQSVRSRLTSPVPARRSMRRAM